MSCNYISKLSNRKNKTSSTFVAACNDGLFSKFEPAERIVIYGFGLEIISKHVGLNGILRKKLKSLIYHDRGQYSCRSPGFNRVLYRSFGIAFPRETRV